MSDKKDNKFGFSEGTAVDLDGGAISEAHEKSALAGRTQSKDPPEEPDATAPKTSDNEVIAATMAMDSELIAEQLLGNVAARELKLRSNDIGVKGCTALCEQLQHMNSTGEGGSKAVTHLDLNGNPLGEESCDTLCNMLRATQSIVL